MVQSGYQETFLSLERVRYAILLCANPALRYKICLDLPQQTSALLVGSSLGDREHTVLLLCAMSELCTGGLSPGKYYPMRAAGQLLLPRFHSAGRVKATGVVFLVAYPGRRAF